MDCIYYGFEGAAKEPGGRRRAKESVALRSKSFACPWLSLVILIMQKGSQDGANS